jgi:5-methylthioadenosine/S-adenosylhomocysteine deaminase
LAGAGPQWSLLLDHEEPLDTAIRPHFPPGPTEESTAPRLAEIMALQVPLSELLMPLHLDPLTVSDDRAFFGRLVEQSNLPDYVSERLPALF